MASNHKDKPGALDKTAAGGDAWAGNGVERSRSKLDYTFEDSFYYLHKSLPNPPPTLLFTLRTAQQNEKQKNKEEKRKKFIIQWRTAFKISWLKN